MTTQIDASLINAAQAELGPDERLLWAGRPSAGWMTIHALPIGIFGVIFTLFALNLLSGFHAALPHAIGPQVSFSGPPGWTPPEVVTPPVGPSVPGASMFELIPILIIVVGIVMAFSPLWMGMSAGMTTYAISNKRVLIIIDAGIRKVQSYGPKDMCHIERVDRGDGTGDLAFAQVPVRNSNRYAHMRTVKFVGIQNVREVERILRSAFFDVQQPNGDEQLTWPFGSQ